MIFLPAMLYTLGGASMSVVVALVFPVNLRCNHHQAVRLWFDKLHETSH